MLKSYLKKIFKIANQGDARKESYYATLIFGSRIESSIL